MARRMGVACVANRFGAATLVVQCRHGSESEGENIVPDKLNLEDLQSDGGLFAPTRPLHAVWEEHRHSNRRQMDADGALTIDGAIVSIRTADISLGGLCIRSARQLAVGKEYPLSFDLAVGDTTRRVAVTVDVIYCFHTVEQDFKAGVEFVNPAPGVIDDIKQLIGE
jgi:hypothetical protein